MSTGRTGASGLAHAVLQKQLAKFDEKQAHEVLEWIKEVSKEDINTAGDISNFCETLRNGQVLCKFANGLEPGIVKKIQTGTGNFPCMENINAFVNAAKKLGELDAGDTFQSVDLFERRDLFSVVTCIRAMARKLGKNF